MQELSKLTNEAIYSNPIWEKRLEELEKDKEKYFDENLIIKRSEKRDKEMREEINQELFDFSREIWLNTKKINRIKNVEGKQCYYSDDVKQVLIELIGLDDY